MGAHGQIHGLVYSNILVRAHGQIHGSVYNNILVGAHGQIHGSVYSNILVRAHGQIHGSVYNNILVGAHGQVHGSVYTSESPWTSHPTKTKQCNLREVFLENSVKYIFRDENWKLKIEINIG